VFRQISLSPVLLNIDFEDPVAAVVADYDFRADLVMRGRPQRLNRVHGAPVAGEAEHRPLGLSQLKAQRSGDSHPQGAAPSLEVGTGPVWYEITDEIRRRGDRLVEDDEVIGSQLGQLSHELGGRHRQLAPARPVGATLGFLLLALFRGELVAALLGRRLLCW